VSFLFSKSENIGFCLDVKGVVQRDGKIRNGILRKGDPIYNGDKIITGSNGFVFYTFIHEKTSAKIFENSVVKINTNMKNIGSFSRLALFGGKVVIQTEESEEDPFTIWSPSSTCKFQNGHIIIEYKNELLYENNSYCLFTVLNGISEVKNNISDNIIYVKKGRSVVSTMNGKFLELETFRNSNEIQKTLIIKQGLK
jgi:hypothetical protein